MNEPKYEIVLADQTRRKAPSRHIELVIRATLAARRMARWVGMATRYVSERFVGRERELSRLAVALDAATDGRSPRVLIGGPGGTGVSRLVDETVRRVDRL